MHSQFPINGREAQIMREKMTTYLEMKLAQKIWNST
jgi:hypothetical protein